MQSCHVDLLCNHSIFKLKFRWLQGHTIGTFVKEKAQQKEIPTKGIKQVEEEDGKALPSSVGLVQCKMCDIIIYEYFPCCFFFFFWFNESNKEVFKKGKRMNYKNKFIERMFYFVMISSTMVMRELLLQYFIFLVIHGFGTLWCTIDDSCEFPWRLKGFSMYNDFPKDLKRIKIKVHK